jgi:hypothetical protein
LKQGKTGNEEGSVMGSGVLVSCSRGKKLGIRVQFGGQHYDKNFDRVGREINAQSVPHSENTVSVIKKLQKLYFTM